MVFYLIKLLEPDFTYFIKTLSFLDSVYIERSELLCKTYKKYRQKVRTIPAKDRSSFEIFGC